MPKVQTSPDFLLAEIIRKASYWLEPVRDVKISANRSSRIPWGTVGKQCDWSVLGPVKVQMMY